jgi:hypothetical protein
MAIVINVRHPVRHEEQSQIDRERRRNEGLRPGSRIHVPQDGGIFRRIPVALQRLGHLEGDGQAGDRMGKNLLFTRGSVLNAVQLSYEAVNQTIFRMAAAVNCKNSCVPWFPS